MEIEAAEGNEVIRWIEESESEKVRQLPLVLLRSVNAVDVKCPMEGKGEGKGKGKGKSDDNSYSRIDFHLVDLNEDRLLKNCLPMLLWRGGGIDSMVSLGNSATYVIGSKGFLYDAAAAAAIEEQVDVKVNGGYGIALRDPEARWKSVPDPIHYLPIPVCASLFGKIYAFARTLDFPPQVLDPYDNKWRSTSITLPTILVGCRVSIPVVPDPNNRRILLHLFDGLLRTPSLYAFYPEGRPDGGSSWECLTTFFYSWNVAVTVEKGVLYTPVKKNKRFELWAYDLVSQQLLDIKWSSQLLNVDITTIEFDAFLNLGNGMLCLAVFSPDFHAHPIVTQVFFFKFRVKRLTSASVICASDLSTHSFTLPSAREVVDFVPL